MSWWKRPVLAACLVSSLGHVLFALSTPAPTPRAASAPSSFEVTLSIQADTQPEAAPAEPAPELLSPPERVAATVRAEPKAGGASRQAPSDNEVLLPEPDVAVASPAEPPAKKPSEASAPRSTGTIDLSPRAAAATLRAEISKQLGSGSCTVERGSDPSGSCDAEGGQAQAAPVLPGSGARLPTREEEFPLKRTMGGGYTHSSPAFIAHIDPDGEVMFDDKLRDMNDIVAKHMVGSQIYTSEKRRFLAATAALREQMANKARAKNQTRGLSVLGRRLQGILNDAAQAPLQKRIAIFALWDDCAHDTLGFEAQQVIEGFVREHLPRGSALAYPASELAELNGRRISKRTFDPYRAS